MNILIISNDTSLSENASTLITSYATGVFCRQVMGAAALEAFQERHWNTVISDLALPKKTTFQLIDQLKAKGANSRILFIGETKTILLNEIINHSMNSKVTFTLSRKSESRMRAQLLHLNPMLPRRNLGNQ